MKYDYDIVIIGAGSAGMVAAEAAANMGVKVALVERAQVGGDCLWTGCVPSKTLLASAKAAFTIKHAERYGLRADGFHVDSAGVWQRIRDVQRQIAATDDNPERYAKLGVDILWGEASFAGGHCVQIAGRAVATRFALVCTGSRPAFPPVLGLAGAEPLTSENVFEQERAPASLAIVGAGPVGIEMAQAMNRLGVQVRVLEIADRILSQDEPELAEILQQRLEEEGVKFELGVELRSVDSDESGRTLCGQVSGDERRWQVEQILLAAGRRPNIDSLALEKVGIETGPRGIIVDKNLRTSAKWVYAAGDCAGRYLFTHSAAAEAVTALRNMFFPGSAPAPDLIPWTTFTDPELAHVGLTADEARRRIGSNSVRVFGWDLEHSDRARADGATTGKLAVVTDNRFRVLGAHILAPCAGQMISQFTLAIKHHLRLTPDFANLVQVYPTYSTSVSQTAGDATYGQLQRPFLRALRRINDLFSG